MYVCVNIYIYIYIYIHTHTKSYRHPAKTLGQTACKTMTSRQAGSTNDTGVC